MAKQITVRVSCNIWGNYNGFVTGAIRKELGASEFDATYWASEQLTAHPGAVLSPRSYITMALVEALRASLAHPVRRVK